jgi:2-polyprenyl-3-methyl-5-hydroxy-6-metoxy-1,4-benzoquinol methylase
MKQFREFIREGISTDTKELTELLVDTVYSHYIDDHDKNSIECVGWLDGSENAQLRFQKIYEAGIDDDDSVLDVGCGVAHLHTYLKNQGWNGKYLGIDPNKKAIDLVDENINAVHATVEDIAKNEKWDWAIANGVFNLGLKEEHSFWIIENMISHANKGIIFNMLLAPYEDPKYEAYDPKWVKLKLEKYGHKKIEIIEDYMGDDAEFTVYFYKENE